MLQNAQLQNAQLQNAQYNKTHNFKTPKATKRPMLKNVQCYKKSTFYVKKNTLSVEVLRIITDSRNVLYSSEKPN